MSTPPAEVSELAERRAAARARRDFATADALRDEIGRHGWQVRDTSEGHQLTPAPPYRVLPGPGDIPDRSREPDTHRATVGLLAEGWPDDLRACVQALCTHAPEGVVVTVLDLGNIDGAGDVVHELAQEHPRQVREWHVSDPTGWGRARNALLRADTATVHVIMDSSTILEGDALTPLLACLDDPSVAGAGWRGVDADDGWLAFHDAGSGEVEAVLGYLFAFRRRAGLDVGFPPKARFYRNADLEFSLSLRDAGLGRLVVPERPLPLRQERHRGYHDTDPGYRDRESKRNYERLLRRFKGRDDLRVPGQQARSTNTASEEGRRDP